MKLVSLNISLFDSNNKQVADFLGHNKFDFVCLQEVSRRLDDMVDGRYISKEAIDAATRNLKHYFYGPTKVMGNFEQKNFHGKEVFRHEFGGLLEIGCYTKSRFAIYDAHNVFVQHYFSYTTDNSRWPDEDVRSVCITDHECEGKKLRILNYHGVWTQNKLGNEKALYANKEIKKFALNFDGAVIICGDFNLFPHTEHMKLFEDNFTSLIDKYNIETTRPESNELHGKGRNVVDYIWVNKDVKVNNFSVLKEDASDHLPLVLDFSL